MESIDPSLIVTLLGMLLVAGDAQGLIDYDISTGWPTVYEV